MTRPLHELPKLLRHVDKQNDRVRAYFNFGGRRHNCGEWGTAEATARYHRLLDEIVRPKIEARLGIECGRSLSPLAAEGSASRARVQPVPGTPTAKVTTGTFLVLQLCAAYWQSIENREKRLSAASGKPRRKPQVFYSIRSLSETYGALPVDDFSPARLIAYQSHIVEKEGLNLRNANRRVQHVVSIFKWGSVRELVHVDTYARLNIVEPLKEGDADGSIKQVPVSDDAVKATLPFLSPRLATMVVVNLVTAMRPKEVVELRGADLIRTKSGLAYCPRDHKNKHREQKNREHKRVVPIPPHVEDMLRPYMKDDPEAFIFDPRDEVREQNAEKARLRRTKVPPSQRLRHERRLQNPSDRLGDHYTTLSYGKAIKRACVRAAIAVWTPYQLRHAGATHVANSVSIVAAQALLGHRQISTTMNYVQADCEKAAKALAQDHEANSGRITDMKTLIPNRRPLPTQLDAGLSTP